MESTIERTLCHVVLLSKHLDHYNLRGAIIVALMELGVPTKCIGFEFLKKAIELQRKDPTRALTKDIYLEISLHYKQNSEELVEQAIRDAIKMAWRRGSKEAWEWYFSRRHHRVGINHKLKICTKNPPPCGGGFFPMIRLYAKSNRGR